MTKISAVYKIINTVTNDCYVGSSKDVMRRWKDHKCPSRWKEHPNNQLYKDFQKYGIDKFRFQMLCPVEPEHLKDVEQELIDMMEPAYNSVNAKGLDVEKVKEYQGKYNQSEKGKETRRKYQMKYKHQLCCYNGETLTLNALLRRFQRSGVEHPAIEAKKYLLEAV